MSKKKLKWTVEFAVDPSWVADGFALTAEDARDMIAKRIRGGYGHEVSAKVLTAPPVSKIATLQGYSNVECFLLDGPYKLTKRGTIKAAL